MAEGANGFRTVAIEGKMKVVPVDWTGSAAKS
jgi:hypothetical protein